MDGAVPGCLQEMETVGRGNARRSGVPCARNPLGTLTSNIWVSLLSCELQQMRQCKYWCLAASGGWFAISGDAPLVQVTLAGLRSELVQPKMCKKPRFVKGNGRLGGAGTIIV